MVVTAAFAPVARYDAVGGAERFAGENHVGRFQAPALLVIGMDMLVPEAALGYSREERGVGQDQNLGAGLQFALVEISVNLCRIRTMRAVFPLHPGLPGLLVDPPSRGQPARLVRSSQPDCW